MKTYKVQVFVNKNNKFGNPVGIIFDTDKKIETTKRQETAKLLGFSESVFINDLNPVDVSIFNPQQEVRFAGHAILGVAWLINKTTNQLPDSINCLGGTVKTWQEQDTTWIRASLDMMPHWKYEQLKSKEEVEKITPYEASLKEHTFVWAWIDKSKSLIRARTFASEWGIPEDEANGSGSMQLSANLNQEIEILHGKGSVIYAKPSGKNFADVGGQATEKLIFL